MRYCFILVLFALLFSLSLSSQDLRDIQLSSEDNMGVKEFVTSTGRLGTGGLSLFSAMLGDELVFSENLTPKRSGDTLWYVYNDRLAVSYFIEESVGEVFTASLRFKNIGTDTIELHNVVPFGEAKERVYITGQGKHGLSRTHLFRPGLQPVNVIVPDNAWNLGFCEISIEGNHYYGLTRRAASFSVGLRRFENMIYPGSWVEYDLYVESYTGEWQEGLRKAFQERWLFDLQEFDQTLYQREDLQWIKSSYASHLIYGWDHAFYESELGQYSLDQFLVRGKRWYGGDDFIGICSCL